MSQNTSTDSLHRSERSRSTRRGPGSQPESLTDTVDYGQPPSMVSTIMCPEDGENLLPLSGDPPSPPGDGDTSSPRELSGLERSRRTANCSGLPSSRPRSASDRSSDLRMNEEDEDDGKLMRAGKLSQVQSHKWVHICPQHTRSSRRRKSVQQMHQDRKCILKRRSRGDWRLQ